MKVIVTLTVTGETEIEGYANFADTDVLEQKGIGMWLDRWRYAEGKGREHKSRVFCPWTSVLMVETKDEVQEQVHRTSS